MRVTLIPSDAVIIIDDESFTIDFKGIDPHIHAVQWEGEQGEIEFTDDQENKEISDISEFDPYIRQGLAQKDLNEKKRADPYHGMDSNERAEFNANLAQTEQEMLLRELSQEEMRERLGLSTLSSAEKIASMKAKIKRLHDSIINKNPQPIHSNLFHLFNQPDDADSADLVFAKWNVQENYHIDDHVTHNGKNWVATSDNVGNEPDNVPGDWAEVD